MADDPTAEKYYALLGVSATAAESDIKHAYKKV